MAVMQIELDHLEARLEEVLSEFGRMRDENVVLRAHAGELEREKQVLEQKLKVAIHRIEAMLARLPETEDEGQDA